MDDQSNLRIQDLLPNVDEAVSCSSKAQMAQCARLLATYVALYKHKFGELSHAEYAEFGAQITDSLEFGEAVYSSGLQELLETLALVEVHGIDLAPPPRTLRTIN